MILFRRCALLTCPGQYELPSYRVFRFCHLIRWSVYQAIRAALSATLTYTMLYRECTPSGHLLERQSASWGAPRLCSGGPASQELAGRRPLVPARVSACEAQSVEGPPSTPTSSLGTAAAMWDGAAVCPGPAARRRSCCGSCVGITECGGWSPATGHVTVVWGSLSAVTGHLTLVGDADTGHVTVVRVCDSHVFNKLSRGETAGVSPSCEDLPAVLLLM